MHRFAVLSSLWLIQHAAWSADGGTCDSRLLDRVGQHLQLSDVALPEEHGGQIVSAACKPWPGHASRSIATFAYGADEFQKDWLVVLYDDDRGEVLASFRGLIDVDGGGRLRSESLQIDTARYLLSESMRAFAVRRNTSWERCTHEGGADNELTLFVVEQGALRPVLNLTMSHWRYGQGNRCGGEEVNRTQADLFIAIEPTRHHGFADLRITATSDDGRAPISHIVEYDGNHYDVQAWHAVFAGWWEATEVANVPETAMLVAAGSGDLAKVSALIDGGVELDAFSNGNTTPLHAAVAGGHRAMLDLLLDRGADVNATNQIGDRPLHEAAEAGNLEMIQQLLERGADVNAIGYLQLSALHRAAAKPQLAAVRLLVRHGADINIRPWLKNPPLHYAAMGGDPDIMRLMIERGADVRATDQAGRTALHRAAMSGQRAAIELLLSHGALVNAGDENLATPLHWAAHIGHVEVITGLIDVGGDLLARDREGMTPLDWARRVASPAAIALIEARSAAVVDEARRAAEAHAEALVDAAMRRDQARLQHVLDGGADINAVNRHGRTALYQAALMDDLELVGLLLSRGASPHVTSEGRTALHAAAERGWGALITTLLQAHAEVDSQDSDGRTALFLAMAKRHERAVELLLAQAFDAARLDIEGNSLLHIAASVGNPQWVTALLNKRLDVNAQNLHGITPLHGAVISGNVEVVTLLLDRGAMVNASASEGSPLWVAVQRVIEYREGSDVVKLLLEHGADVEATGPAGDTVAERVAGSGNADLIALFAMSASPHPPVEGRPQTD